MGKNYYLSKGNLNQKYENIKLKEIFNDMKSLEDIDIYTSNFANLEELRYELIKKGLIRSTDDICIGTYKTKRGVKSLTPIYNRRLIFKNDLEKLGFKGKNYEEIALELKEYIHARFNDMDFMFYIIDNYYKKYAPKEDDENKKIKKAPIYESGDISILYRIINSKDKTARDEREYAVSFKNFINNELYKCEIVLEDVAFSEKDSEPIKIFKPIKNKINIKGLHDLLCHIINYSINHNYEYNRNTVNQEIENAQINTDDYETEEYLEKRDYERTLKKYADEVGLDLSDNDALERNEYANSLVSDAQRLVRKYDGME